MLTGLPDAAIRIIRRLAVIHWPSHDQLPTIHSFDFNGQMKPCTVDALRSEILTFSSLSPSIRQILPGVIVKPALWAALVAFHFALSLSIDIVVGSVGGLFSLHLASQAYFVLWSLALSLGYFAAFAPAIRAAKSLQAIENAMSREATVIAGEDYEERYTVTFDGHGSIENQLENLGVVEYGSGINDIVSKAVEMEAEAIIVANSAEPPKLPYESDDE